jgi:hypothetical protein
MRKIEVEEKDSRPASLIWNRVRQTVLRIADHWREHGRWWDGESCAEFFLVDIPQGRFLLRWDQSAGNWHGKPVH